MKKVRYSSVCEFQPAWTLIDAIQQQSEIHALQFMNAIQKKNLDLSRNISKLRNQEKDLEKLVEKLQALYLDADV